MSFINTPAISLLEQSLNAASLRQKVLNNNIANIDTPNFKRSDVSFQDVLQQALSGDSLTGQTDDSRDISIGTSSIQDVQPTVYTDTATASRMDGNNVNIDTEMTNIATNQIQYNALIEQLNQNFGLLRYAITEGKG